MIRNQAGQVAEAEVINATTGAAFVGTVTVYVKIDTGTQVIGSVGSGLASASGNGLYTYLPSQAETDGALIAFTFTGTGAIPATTQYPTVTAAQQQALQSATGTSVITVGDLITASLRRINVVAAGEAPSAEDSADALLRLKMLLGSWRLERLTIPFIQRTTWTISSSKGTLASPYTVGSGGDINVARPSLPNDLRVFYQDTAVSPTLERQLYPLTEAGWQAIPQKNLTSALPTYYYYNPTYASGLGSLYLWLVPTQSNLQGVLYAPLGIADYSSLSDAILLPDGYTLALQDNLALLLWPEWREHVPVDPLLVDSARSSKALLKAANLRPMDLSLDPAVLMGRSGGYSIYSDS